LGWVYDQAYRFTVIHRPKIGLIRITLDGLKEGKLDSGNIISNSFKGGRLGIMAFSQEGVIFSKVKYRCNGKTTCVPGIYTDLVHSTV